MNVLIACEESQVVCNAFRKLGHNAFSCDIVDCSGGHPEWHLKYDVLQLLDNQFFCFTCDGKKHYIVKWDLIIAHPPCTYLTVSGNRWFNVSKYGESALLRILEREKAVNFFMEFVKFASLNPSLKLCIENPIGVMSSYYRKPNQIIQPYYFGEPERKSTCLWLFNLNPLTATNIVQPIIIKHKSGKTDSFIHYSTLSLPKEERQRIRSRTFEGVANAMASQWGNCTNDYT